MTQFRVSTSARCPTATSLTKVSGILSSAFSLVGSDTRANTSPGTDELPDLDFHQLEDAENSGADREPVELLLAQRNQGVHLLDPRILGGKLCFRGRLARLFASPLQLDPLPILPHRDSRFHERYLVDQALTCQLEVRVVLRFRLQILALKLSGSGVLVEPLVLKLGLEVRQVSLGPFSCASASRYSCSTCGLLSSRRAVDGRTSCPGWTCRSSTRPASLAAITTIVSGTKVPIPRTWRSISPRLTESVKTTAEFTEGAAGSSRETAHPSTPTTTAALEARAICRMRCFRAQPTRGLSIGPSPAAFVKLMASALIAMEQCNLHNVWSSRPPTASSGQGFV